MHWSMPPILVGKLDYVEEVMILLTMWLRLIINVVAD